MSSGLAIGKNVTARLKEGDKKNVVVLTINPSNTLGPSASGKTEMIGQISTPIGGTKATAGGNIYVKVGEKPVISKTEPVEIGKNLTWYMDGKLLFIELDLSNAENEKDVSSSGKTILLASSRGNKLLGSSKITLGFNAYIKVGETFNAPALAKWLATDGSTTVGPFDFDNKGEYYTLTASLADGDGDVTTKQFVPMDGENKVNLTLGKASTLEDTKGKFEEIADAFNVQMKVNAADKVVSIRMRKDGDNGPTSSNKSIMVASNKKVRTFNGVKISLNAIKPLALNPEDVRKEIVAFLEEKEYNIAEVKEKELRTVVGEKVAPPQDPSDGKFKELVRKLVKEVFAARGEGDANAVDASQLSKRCREGDEDVGKEDDADE